MVAISPLMVIFLLPLLQGSSDGKNIWTAFMSEGSTARPSHQHDLCPMLIGEMERVNTGTPDTCQPHADGVSGNIGCHYIKMYL